jgi:hypothetical protein
MPNDWVPIIREDIVQRVIEKHLFTTWPTSMTKR